jgi:Tfp pilus assembly protein PilO
MIAAPWLNAIVSRLVGAPGWFRCLVLLMLGAALAGLCWWLVLQELQQSMPAKSPARKVEEGRLIERQSAVQKAEHQRAQVHLEKEQLTALESVLPAGDDAQSAWAAVHQASRRHGLRMEQFKPGPVGSETPYPQQRAALRLSGSFGALLAFTRTLAEAGSPVSLESYFLVSPAGAAAAAGSDGRGNLILEATLLSLHRPAPTAAPAVAAALATASSAAAERSKAPPALQVVSAPLPGAPRDPFESQRLTPSPASDSAAVNALNSLPLSAMRMVGSVRAADPGKAFTALVLVGGTLYPVRLGDALGNARGRVAEIRADGLTVREPSSPGPPGTAQAVRSNTLLIAKD